MLSSMDLAQNDVSVLLLRRGGVWEKRISRNTKCIYVEELENPKCYIKNLICNGYFIQALKKTLLFLHSVHAKSYWCENYYLTRFLPKLKQEYDVAISYHAPGTLPVHYVLNNITAKKKIIWIHGDVEETKNTDDKYKSLYDQYDKIVCVSREAEKVFLKNFSTMKEKCCVIHNALDTTRIKVLSQEPVNEQFSICTVARLSPEKGIDLALEACEILLKQFPTLRWCVCGDGSEKNKLEKKIIDAHLQKHFILLGDQENPYKYIRASSIYVQPSIHEGYCMTIAEARFLMKPIVSTRTSGALEQLENHENGTLVNADSFRLATAIAELLKDPLLRDKYVTNLERYDWKKRNVDFENVID